MNALKQLLMTTILFLGFMTQSVHVFSQTFPVRYATLELFTNTPCPICGSQNPGLFNRLANYDGEYHLISFYPGKPYSSCVFYQDNIAQNTTRYNHYQGEIFGSPTVALNGIDFKSSSGVTNTVLDNLTGGTSWLHVDVEETSGASREVTIRLEDVAGGSLSTGHLFAVIVEKEVLYNAPNGETVHHNVFRRFLTASAGEEVDMSTGSVTRTYQYDVDNEWDATQTYVIAWLSDPATKEIFNSGTRFDPDVTSTVNPIEPLTATSIYPNPANDVVHVALPDEGASADIEVYDQHGRRVRLLKGQLGPVVQITAADLPQGNYFIRMKAAKRIYAGSFEILR